MKPMLSIWLLTTLLPLGCSDAPDGGKGADSGAELAPADTAFGGDSAGDSTSDATGPDSTALDASDFDGTGFGYLVAEPTSLNFGIRPVGEEYTLELDIENAGNRPLNVSAMTLVNSNEAFLFMNPSPFTLDAGTSRKVMVTFFSLAEQTYDDVLRITSDSASGSVLDVPVSGGGIVFECVDLDGDLRGPYCELGDDCNQADPNVYEGAPEICNHIDDDCDGAPDEDFTQLGMSCTAGVGVCETAGWTFCSPDGTSTICAVNPVNGGSELCNEADDDCDGATDEDFPELGEPCTVGTGACAVSDKWVCAADGSGVSCNVTPLTPSDELLNDGIDNDCDGLTDEEVNTDIGCADGEREGFVDTSTWPDIAACGGAWSVGGVVSELLTPTCDRQAGDDFANLDGQGCNVSDLCAEGWHVCASSSEVDDRSSTGCEGAATDPIEPAFYIARQSGTGCGQCATGTTTGGACNSPSSCLSGCEPSVFLSNDVFGCGNLGATPNGSCAPLNAFSHNNCNALLPPWACSGSTIEAANIAKSGPEHGGVLCCRD